MLWLVFPCAPACSTGRPTFQGTQHLTSSLELEAPAVQLHESQPLSAHSFLPAELLEQLSAMPRTLPRLGTISCHVVMLCLVLSAPRHSRFHHWEALQEPWTPMTD